MRNRGKNLTIILHAYRVWDTGRVMNVAILFHFPKSHKFDFDIDSHEAWKKYLKSIRIPIKGKIRSLPRYSENYPGAKMAYRVYNWGGRYREYFPGKDDNGKKRFLRDFGTLV